MENSESSGEYLVIARKWRPTTFADVTGQKHIVQALQNAIKLNRLPSAYIFSGIRGVGKTSLARIMARSVNCEKGPTCEPCGECSNCLEIIKGSSLDVIEIDGASNNGVDEVREMRGHLQYAPVKSRKKIYIVDEVHMLSKAAFNAFLKTLEEPPPHTLFIFATTELGKIPETVLSRCQCFEFRAISEDQITEKLVTIAKSENIKITETALRMITRRADGSMRDAQSLLDQISAYSSEEIDEDTVGLVLGLVSRDKIWSLLDAVIKRDVDTALTELNELYYSGYDVTALIRELFEAVRELSVAKVMKAPEKLLEGSDTAIKRVKKMVKDVSAGRLHQFYDILVKTIMQSKSAGNAISILEMGLIKMMHLDDVVPVDEIIRKMKSLGAVAGRPPQQPSYRPPHTASLNTAQPPQAPPLQQAATASGTTGHAPVSCLASIREKILNENPRVGALLDDVIEMTTNDSDAILYFPTNSLKELCEQHFALLEKVVKEETGRKLKLDLRESAEPHQITSEKKTANNLAMKEKLLKDPLIEKAIEMFEGYPEFES